MIRPADRIILFSCLIFLLGSCAEPVEKEPPEELTGLENFKFGTDSTLEIITWNLKEFPLANSETVTYVSQIIYYLDVDIIALQEIGDASKFDEVVADLNQRDSLSIWDGYRSDEAYLNIDLAIIFKSSYVISNYIYEIYQNDSDAFPRPPLIIDFNIGNIQYFVINNHLKALSGSDNEDRRRAASQKLQDYIQANLAGENVVIVGDLNDEIQEPADQNVFQNFINAPTEYKFTDMEIAIGSQYSWSYPSYPSHLDHILITSELFDEFAKSESEVKTIRIHDELEGGWNVYSTKISDHLPVAWRFAP